MTIDEIITTERDNAEFSKLNDHDKSADYHKQIAQCLEELKAYRENSNGYNKEDIELNRNAMYNKAIDDAIKIVKENYRMEALERLEKIKAGERNEQASNIHA